MRALLEDEQQGGDHQQVEEMFQEEEGDDEFEGKGAFPTRRVRAQEVEQSRADVS